MLLGYMCMLLAHAFTLLGHTFALLGHMLTLLGHTFTLLGHTFTLLGHTIGLLGHTIGFTTRFKREIYTCKYYLQTSLIIYVKIFHKTRLRFKYAPKTSKWTLLQA